MSDKKLSRHALFFGGFAAEQGPRVFSWKELQWRAVAGESLASRPSPAGDRRARNEPGFANLANQMS